MTYGQSLLPIPDSLLPTPYSLLPTPYSLLPTPYTLLPTPYSLHRSSSQPISQQNKSRPVNGVIICLALQQLLLSLT
ncbi:hypothetical protein [Moorena sp. SIO4G3]|uniref:hypothetical protein n=1 Tax=Moorena sp. SIO4G3 TaxID=2607821 RepID=UPI00142A4285|nr:hypothetical protein [Moorena sp. SIO4G3]NEO77307.1 hypothetical protein [Moorena sp. SIO4G3]